MLPTVRIEDNKNGTWTAYIYSTSFTGSYQDCQNWIKWNCPGEYW